MPFNVTHNHWLVACVNVEEGAIVVYDSLSGRSDTGTSAHESIIDVSYRVHSYFISLTCLSRCGIFSYGCMPLWVGRTLRRRSGVILHLSR